jgi:hypothetical protein
MSQLKDLDELAICIDISARMALYSLAKTCGDEEIKQFFGRVKVFLDEEYDSDKVAPLIEAYKAAAINLTNGKDEHRGGM